MESKYEQLKLKARVFYLTIKPVVCPMINNELVSFNEKGFRHLIYKGRFRRSKKDQMRRFRLLPLVTKVLEDKFAKVIYRNEITAEFWGLQSIIDKKVITVIVRKIGNGQKHFFSITDLYTKKSP
jgi:hypothetical protein